MPLPHMDELYSSLGYSKAESLGQFKVLDRDIDAYFIAYEKEFHILGVKERLSDKILLCATNYLTEKSRGDQFWPDDGRGAPVWPADAHL